MAPEEDITRAVPGAAEHPDGAAVPAAEPEAPVSAAVSEQDPEEQPEHPEQPEGPDPSPATPGAPAPEPAAPTGPSQTPPASPGGPPAPPPTHNEGDTSGGEDHERRLERDLEELTAKAEKADEYLELAKRTKADFENYRKRATRDAAAAQERGIAKLARELLPAVDNLDRAVEAAESHSSDNGAENLLSGIKLVHADVLAALQRAGIERYSPEGEPFDPQRHEAVAQQPVEGAQPGTIVEVYQRGYLLGDAVIRPARVVVAG
jgi:molecular chaperone GrpE